MTNRKKRKICKIILQSYDRNVWNGLRLRLRYTPKTGVLIVTGVPHYNFIQFSRGYDEFCFGAMYLGVYQYSFPEWTQMPTTPDVNKAYAGMYRLLAGASSWEEIELRLAVGGF